jgi:hypothetical protein
MPMGSGYLFRESTSPGPCGIALTFVCLLGSRALLRDGLLYVAGLTIVDGVNIALMLQNNDALHSAGSTMAVALTMSKSQSRCTPARTRKTLV